MEKNSAEADSGNDVFIRRESAVTGASEYYTAAESLGTTGSSFHQNGETFTLESQNVSSVNETFTIESQFQKLRLTENKENVKPSFLRAENDTALDGKQFEWTFVRNF